MQKEKIAIIGLVIIIIILLAAVIIITNPDIFQNLFEKKEETKNIEIGDCADVNYIVKYSSNNTVFSSSYNDTINKTGGTPLKVFVSTNTSEYPPTAYEDYTNLIDYYYVKGFIEGLVGLKEGDNTTIGPIQPEDAYGVYPTAGDVITISDPQTGKEIEIQIVNISNNSSMPEEYVSDYGNGTTTLFVLRFDMYSLYERITSYPSWENATVVTQINDTMLWMYTTPPEDKSENFTWVQIENGGQSEITYPENASSVTTINDTTIVITHNPQINDTMEVYDYYYGSSTVYTVVNLTDEKINVSYVDDTDNISYVEFNRTVTIVRNETQNITQTLPLPAMEQFLSLIKYWYDPNLIYSVHELAGESLTYEVEIVKVYKNS